MEKPAPLNRQIAPTREQYSGCLLGLATGDALCAPFEGGLMERGLWRLIGRTRQRELRWTDDTQMAIDLAESLLESGGLEPDHVAKRFAESYRWSRGYGRGTARVLKRIRRGENWASASRAVFPAGSFGNGAAMRSPILALFFFDDSEALLSSARSAAEITHVHPLGVEGAVLLAVAAREFLRRSDRQRIVEAVRAVCQSPEIVRRLDVASSWLDSAAAPSPALVAAGLGNGQTAQTSCVTALYVALRFMESDFEEMMNLVISCRGDTDTIAAMAGSLWGALNGATGIPKIAIEKRERLEDLARQLFEHLASRRGA